MNSSLSLPLSPWATGPRSDSSSDHPTDQAVDAEPSASRSRPTSRSAWILLFTVDVVLCAVALPRLIERVRAAIPADVVRSVGDPGMVDTAVRIGAYVSLPFHVLTLLVFALVAGSIERHLLPTRLQVTSRISVGAGWVLVALTLLPARIMTVADVEWTNATTVAGLTALALAGATWLSWSDLRAMSTLRRACCLGAALLFVLAMSMGK